MINFTMTEQDFESKLVVLARTKSEFVNAVQELLTAGMEFGIANANATALNKVLDILDGAMRKVAGTYMSSQSVPFVFTEGKLKYAQSKALGILKKIGHETTKPENGGPLPVEFAEYLVAAGRGYMAGVRWDAETKVTKDKQAKPELTLDDLKKRFNKLQKDAEKAGLDLKDAVPATLVKERPENPQAVVLSPKMKQIFHMLSQYEVPGDNTLDLLIQAILNTLAKVEKRAA